MLDMLLPAPQRAASFSHQPGTASPTRQGCQSGPKAPLGSPAHSSAGVLFLSPLIAGFTLSRLIASPLLDSIEAWNPRAFELSDNQKVEGFREVKKAELRIRMEAALGRAPPLKGGPLLPPDVSVGLRPLLHGVARALLWARRRALSCHATPAAACWCGMRPCSQVRRQRTKRP